MFKLEILNDAVNRDRFHSVIFDFDGTISLIREGWVEIMTPYFAEVLAACPRGGSVKEETPVAREFIDLLTGRQTIYQCIRLAEEVAARGGVPEEPIQYKWEYLHRLDEHIDSRRQGLRGGKINPRDWVVAGSFEFLEALKERGLKLYLASGTDESFVVDEAQLLGVDRYFDGIFGAKDDYKLFSKAMVIERIIEDHDLAGEQLAGFGDGFVEIENVKAAGGLAVGVASNEQTRVGVDPWKRDRLIDAGADAIIPDFSDVKQLLGWLCL
jgi:phosphoglycolate phosphatase-like HAD superfamily hydrolase